jgi:hypothetical protein
VVPAQRRGESVSAYRFRKRVEVIKRLCGKGKRVRCMCPGCRISGMRYINSLTIDHVNGDGAGHLKKNGERIRGYDLVSHISKSTQTRDYTVLCSNCNVAKGQRGFCPLANQRH